MNGVAADDALFDEPVRYHKVLFYKLCFRGHLTLCMLAAKGAV